MVNTHIPRPLHGWDLDVPAAQALQLQLAKKVVTDRPLPTPKLIAGVDVSVREEVSRAAIVVLTYPGLQPIEQATATRPVTFPYIPGLLAFRETPVILEAIANLTHDPDVYMVDGQGMAHPRRFGIACHLGLWLNRSTIGCAKSRLTGQYVEPGPEPGSRSPLLADHQQIIGMVLRTKLRSNPLFISVGHLADLESAVALVESCVRGYRLPEPTRWAHNVAGGAVIGGQQSMF
jgi:deoxyribonuclease V